MKIRKTALVSRAMLVSSCFALFGYGCSSDPVGDDGGAATGGSSGTGTGGTATGGTATGGTATGGSAGSGVSGSAGSGVAGSATGGVAGSGVSGSAGTGIGGAAGTGAGMGGTAGTGNPGGSGGSSAGTAGTPSGGGGGVGGANNDANCKSIKSNMMCMLPTMPNQACPNLACGLGDSGRRACNCTAANTWMCESCNFMNSWIRDRPATIPACSGVVEGTACAANVDSPASICSQPVATPQQYCVCATDPRNSALPPEWNCDAAPTSWTP